MAIKFLNHLDLTQNEFQNAALHNTESSDIATPVSGQIIFDNGTGVNKLKYYDGSNWLPLSGDYSHPSHTARTIDLDATGASVISTIDFTSDVLGHVTSASATTRTLTLGDLGYTGDTDANNYVHPNHTGHVTSTGDGDTVLTVVAITGQDEETNSTNLNLTDEFVMNLGGAIRRLDLSVLQSYFQNNLTFTTDTNTDTLQSVSFPTSNADSDFYISFVENSSGAQEAFVDDGFTWNPQTNTLSVDNIIVAGTTTTVNTEIINLADNIITLNSNAPATPTENAGLEVERGDSTNVSLVWNETTDRWTFTNDGTTFYNIPIDTEYDNFNFNVEVDGTSQEVSDGGTLTFVQGGGLSVGISSDDEISYSHADTSTQTSVDNSGRTYIQDITLDTYGHITGITSATETVTNTDTQLATKEADIDVSDTDFVANKRATINHALNSENVIVQMYDKTTGAVVHADVEHTSDGSTISKNHVRIEFGVVPDNDIRVIMIDAKDAATSVTPSYS